MGDWLGGFTAGLLGLWIVRHLVRHVAGSRRLRELAARRAAGHDRFVDLLRVVGILSVVLGHWLAVYLERTRDGVRGGNILALDPWLWPLTWVIQVMPLFFVAGGSANAFAFQAASARGDAYADFVARRLRRLLRPVLTFCAIWVGVLLVLHAAGVTVVAPQLLGRLVGQPLWFLAVYVVVIALVPATLWLHRRWPRRTLVGLLVGVVAADVARLGLDWAAAGFVNLALVWVLLHQYGYWYAAGRLPAIPTRRWWMVAGLGLLLLAGLVAGPYPASMVGLPGAPVSNMNPPTVCIVVLGTIQTAVAMMAHGPVTRWLERERPWTFASATGAVAMPAYLWHLPAMVVVAAGLVIADVPLPDPGRAAWWLSRPLWIAVCVLVLLPLILAARRLDAVLARAHLLPARPRPATSSRARDVLAGLAVGSAAFGLFGIVVAGLDPLDSAGGRLIVLPVSPLQSLAALVIAWLLIRVVGQKNVPAATTPEAG